MPRSILMPLAVGLAVLSLLAIERARGEPVSDEVRDAIESRFISVIDDAADYRRMSAMEPLGELLEPEHAATRAGGRVLELIDEVRAGVRETRYQHRTQVRVKDGLYAWDCSGMASWIVRRAAPRAHQALSSSRPVARTFYRTITKAPVGKSKRGWQRIDSVLELRPGDVFAWERPADWPGNITGHVGFIVSYPIPVPGLDRAYAVRIVDSTRYPHQDDTRADDGEGGFGFGTILLLTDEQGAATAYAWHGAFSRWAVTNDIALGRLVR